ncbi:MAG: hypothetical protein GC168_21025 [Candidatus Hydrogenedens sp.]|nr:hypothetical protein [Candidatus Hydrogenedens sp.]
MQAEDRVIHFSVELVHAPSTSSKESLQRLYYELSQSRTAGYDSTDFTNMAAPRFYSRRGQKTQSIAVFLPDRLVLIEEWADMALSDFLEKIREIAPKVLAARGVPEFVAHTVTIRSTFALSHYEDARIFLIDHACGQENRITPHFKRPIAVGGLRFVLPETNEHPGSLNITIESFRHSRSEVFVEVKGIYGRERVTDESMEIVERNVRAVRTFISESVYHYLNQYDTPRPAPEF